MDKPSSRNISDNVFMLGVDLMGRMRSFVMAFFVVVVLCLGFPSHANAHEPHDCPEGYPDTPAISGHISQAQITSGDLSFQEILEAGKHMFEAVFNSCDGQGRPSSTGTGEHREANQPEFTRVSAPDSNSCMGCHNQPRSGGGGDFVTSVFVLGQSLDPVSESINPEFSNERNTLGMFGSGPIEMLAREMTTDLHRIREEALLESAASNELVTMSLLAKGISFGQITANPDGSLDLSQIEGIDSDLIIKPFHQAGVVVSIRQFTNNAMNHHHGMQAEERFDLDPLKGEDYDQDGVERELTIGDITAVTLFQASLGVPGRVIPEDADEHAIVLRGEDVFHQIGCTSCHIPELRLENRFYSEPNPYNPSDNFSDLDQAYSYDMTTQGEGPYLDREGEGAVVRAYTDFKRHNLCDELDRSESIRYYCNEQLAQDRPDQDGKSGEEFFITRKLWDVGSSAPYGHRGDLTTITDAILNHGGEAREAQDVFANLPLDDQEAVVKFLKTLQVLPPVSSLGETALKTAGTRDWQIISISGVILLPVTLIVLALWYRRLDKSDIPLDKGADEN